MEDKIKRPTVLIKLKKEWIIRRNAGLCPICGKSKEDFDKNRKVYCSKKCATEYSKGFVYWNELREEIKEENPICNICGLTPRKWKTCRKKEIKEKYKNTRWCLFMKDLDIYDRDILRLLLRARRPLTTNQISKFSGITWKTTKIHLSRLNKKGHVQRRRKGNRIYWEINKKT